MKRSLLLVFGLLVSITLQLVLCVAYAQELGAIQTSPAYKLPLAWPDQAGSVGSPFHLGTTPEGIWVDWTYTVKGVKHTYLVCATRGFTPVVPIVTADMTAVATLKAYWVANVKQDCRTAPALVPIYEAWLKRST